MAYGKRKRNLTFKSSKRTTASASAIAKKAVQMFPGLVRTSRNYVRTSNNPALLPEKKFHDYNVFINSVADNDPQKNYVAAFGNMLGVKQDTTANGRIGNKITISNINSKLVLLKPAEMSTGAANAHTMVVRIILFRDKQMNSLFPGAADILRLPFNTNNWVYAFRNMDTVDRFDLLVDKTITLTSPAYNATTGDPTAVSTFFKISKKLKDVIHFSGTQGGDAESRSIGYGMLVMTTEGKLVVGNNTRFKYFDA